MGKHEHLTWSVSCYIVVTMFRRALFALLLVVGVTACLSPTLPLPPPEAPSQSLGNEPGTVHLSSLNGVQGDAFVIIVNRSLAPPGDTGVVTQADGTGSWQADVKAVNGDHLSISQQVGNDASASKDVIVSVK